MALVFEWDEVKAGENLRKHRVSFDEAQTVFLDPLAITIQDPDHSADEDRFIELGESAQERIRVVVHTERSRRIRLIRARKASRLERKQYEEGS